MIYAIPAWKHAAYTHVIKLQRLQNQVLRIIGNYPRRTPVAHHRKYKGLKLGGGQAYDRSID
jgi:hypothetical protein